MTERGVARDPRVVDYYREDEPIELGPDENMHDAMIEEIAALSVRRGYLLGGGIMSSKKVGINHKEFGVTSTGVIAFATIAMAERGVDLRKDPFSVKLTGGPNGDVAGNAIRLLLERSPGAAIRLIVDGTAALIDPAGLDRAELARIVLRKDADSFDPARLSPGGVLLYRTQRRTEGLRELHRRVEMTAGGLREDWITLDEFHEEFDQALYRVPADLFIPAGGRPETIDGSTWRRFLLEDGTPSAPVIVEGANSFITPEARLRLQEAGAVVLRDASANKCGVISSSYEIIGNLLLDEREFLAHKTEYVKDVLEILERRAVDEARLIFRRHREAGGKKPFTEISEALSGGDQRGQGAAVRVVPGPPRDPPPAALGRGAPRAPAAARPRDTGVPRAGDAAPLEVPLGDPRRGNRDDDGLPDAARARLRGRAARLRGAHVRGHCPVIRAAHAWNLRCSLAMAPGIERTRTQRPASSNVSERTRAVSYTSPMRPWLA